MPGEGRWMGGGWRWYLVGPVSVLQAGSVPGSACTASLLNGTLRNGDRGTFYVACTTT